MSIDVSMLGPGASDLDIVSWCAANKYVFVTKDWRTSYEERIARQLLTLGVSAVWIRHDRKSNLASLDLLYVAVRDLRKIIAAVAVATAPLYFECRRGVAARVILVPTPNRKRRGGKTK